MITTIRPIRLHYVAIL